MVTPEDNPFLDSDSSVGLAHIRSDVTGSRPHHRHVRHGFREGLGEVSFFFLIVERSVRVVFYFSDDNDVSAPITFQCS